MPSQIDIWRGKQLVLNSIKIPFELFLCEFPGSFEELLHEIARLHGKLR